MRVKKIMKTALIVLAALALIVGLAAALFFLTYKATMSFDFSEKTGEVMHGASGYLYGIAADEVPSREVVESLGITTVSQKVAGGLQHPTGDIDEAAGMLDNAEYLVVYLQDMYDTWYYDRANIMEMRSKGEYDWQSYLDNDYFPKVREKVKELSEKPYADRLVYCIYNECDNALWFGVSQKDENPDNKYGVWCDYNDEGKDNFNSAWKQTCELVKSIVPDAKIGGPGFCDWNRDKMEYFLKYCVSNNCVPEIMIYHELGEKEAFFFDEHYKEYRKLEKELNINELPIIITEYGMMSENGYPGAMAQYITQIESCKVYADNAYWRLANNLNDNCADANTPNAQWWLMRWYADMKGETVKGTNKDILSSNFENYFKYHLDELSFGGFMGIASVSDDGEKIDVVCGAGNRNSRVQLKNLNSTALYGKKVVVTVEMTPYKGLYGEVYKPLIIGEYTVKKLGKSLNVNIGKVDSANAYHITVREQNSEVDIDLKADYYDRFEFEDGTLLGNAYTYKSYCPASKSEKSENDLVGGMENEGDGVEIKFSVSKADKYDLSVIYGNSNDGGYLENGRQDPDGRVHTKALLTLDGNEQEIYLPNTIKSEYTSCYVIENVELSKGEHTLSVKHIEGTYVLDSMVVEKSSSNGEFTCRIFEDEGADGKSVFLTVAPENGYYYLFTPVEIYNRTLYLKKGLNYIEYDEAIKYTPAPIKQEKELNTVSLADIALADGAELKSINIKGETKQYIDGISCNGGKAEFTFNAEKAGEYCLTLTYSNNDEGGVHDYNVDLIERFVTVSVNGEKVKNQYCRNTYSWESVNTVTLNIELKEGENVITLTNDGAVKFNGNDTFAPYIFGVAVNKYEL